MELTVYETFEDFKENYLKDLPAYPGDLLGYLNEYLVLYNDVFDESDKLSAYFHPRYEDDEPLPDHPEIVYPVNRKMFNLQLQQQEYYLKNSYNEKINETLYQFLLFYERVYEFLEKEIQRVEIELKFIKQWGSAGFQQTAISAVTEPDKRELWEKIYERWVDNYNNYPDNHLINFSYLYWKLIKDDLLDRDKCSPKAFRSRLCDNNIMLDRLKSESISMRENVRNEERSRIYYEIKRAITDI